MPTPPSTDAALPSARDRLEARRRELVASIGSVDALPVATGAPTMGETEHLVDAQQREIDEALVDMFRAELEEVEAALQRIAAGTYGSCERCGRPVAEERLRAVPATRTCVSCG